MKDYIKGLYGHFHHYSGPRGVSKYRIICYSGHERYMFFIKDHTGTEKKLLEFIVKYWAK